MNRTLLPLLRSLACGALIGVAGWRGVARLVRQGQPQRLLELAADAAPGNAGTGVTIVFLFRPNECPKLMSVIELLNRIPPSRARVVGALTVEEYRFPGWRELIDAEEIHFPVIRLDPGQVRSAVGHLGYGRGPLLMLFDRDGRVVHITAGLEQRDLADLLDRIIGHVAATVARRTRV